jgi:hypothetical protein
MHKGYTFMFAVAYAFLGAAILLFVLSTPFAHAADSLFRQSMASHYVAPMTVPSSPADIYTKSVWLKSIEFVPQSSTSPNCTVQDKSSTPVIAYNAIQLTPNHSYRDERSDTSPLFMNGGITWSCSDTTVKAQLIVKY